MESVLVNCETSIAVSSINVVVLTPNSSRLALFTFKSAFIGGGLDLVDTLGLFLSVRELKTFLSVFSFPLTLLSSLLLSLTASLTGFFIDVFSEVFLALFFRIGLLADFF